MHTQIEEQLSDLHQVLLRVIQEDVLALEQDLVEQRHVMYPEDLHEPNMESLVLMISVTLARLTDLHMTNVTDVRQVTRIQLLVLHCRWLRLRHLHPRSRPHPYLLRTRVHDRRTSLEELLVLQLAVLHHHWTRIH